jgi:hypothetical protein
MPRTSKQAKADKAAARVKAAAKKTDFNKTLQELSRSSKKLGKVASTKGSPRASANIEDRRGHKPPFIEKMVNLHFDVRNVSPKKRPKKA